MVWTEQETATRASSTVSTDKARFLDKIANESLPVIQKEADSGVRPFETINFQPIKGVNTFEAEFGVRGEDIIFHIWPWGYHDADRKGMQTPRFKPNSDISIRKAMAEVFGVGRIEMSFDSDVGSWFVRACGFSSNQFHRDLCIKAAEKIHYLLGGTR